MPDSVYRTLDDVVEGLGAWERRFSASGDRRAVFLTLYGIVSSEMRARVAERAFADPAWVHRYAVAFADLYRQALEAYEAGNTAAVPKAWRLCFEAARAGTGLVLQDLLLGVNAHVNNDLPVALSNVSIDPDRTARYQDHCAVNAVLGSVTDRATRQIAALYAPGVDMLDDCAGELDELVSLFSLEVARESAWEAAVSLANARSPLEHRLVSTLIGSRATVMARLLLAPTAHPAVLRACRRVEESADVLSLIRAIKSDLHRGIPGC